MKRLAPMLAAWLLLGVGLATCPAADLDLRTLTQEELAEGWISLFDGKTLYGWRPHKGANWRVEEGAITVDKGEVGLLCTSTQFDNYVLKLEFRSPEGTNSGVFLRTSPSPRDVIADCFELNIAPADNPFPTGSLVGRKKTTASWKEGWRTMEATLVGADVIVKIDGKVVLEYKDDSNLRRGFIGLQHNSGEAAFRNISLLPLGLKPLLGEDLSNWKTHPDLTGEFTLKQGELHVSGGKGQLETTGLYGDFIFQHEFRTNAEGLNSGVFFRCIPGDVMMGYECQIHQGYKDGDRTKPVDCGSGGVFRRQDARAVVGDDLKWVSQTLIVNGPHVAAWVNGLQVSDWVDRRKPDVNPRRGRRLEPGSLMLQAHDPTTDISFRNSQIREIAPRKGR